jgi:hypothetical protein
MDIFIILCVGVGLGIFAVLMFRFVDVGVDDFDNEPRFGKTKN